MFALFQAINPSSYVVDEPTSDGTFTEPPGYIETVTSDLTPFWKDASTFHTPETAQSTISLGYAYPETQSWNYKTTDSYQASVKAAIKALYEKKSFSSNAIPSRTKESLKAAPGFQQVSAGPNDKPIVPPTLEREIKVKESIKSPASAIAPEVDNGKNKHHEDTSLLSKINDKIRTATEQVGSLIHQGHGSTLNRASDNATAAMTAHKQIVWIINIRVKKHCLGGPFQIHCFLGDVPSDTDMWLTDANNVGTCSILGSNPATTNCEKCKTDASKGLIVTGVIPLTECLRDAILQGNLPSLNPVDVEPYLAKKLHWRVTQVKLLLRFHVSLVKIAQKLMVPLAFVD
jgi:tyrosinase